jgi:ferredoxin
MKVHLDTTKCQGHLRCYEAASEIFGFDDDGLAVLLVEGGGVPPDYEDAAKLAEDNCPERAITTSD